MRPGGGKLSNPKLLLDVSVCVFVRTPSSSVSVWNFLMRIRLAMPDDETT